MPAAQAPGPTAPPKPAAIPDAISLPECELAEIRRRFVAYSDELAPSGEVGLALVHIAATMSVRMERCTIQEAAALARKVRQAEADFVPPEGCGEAQAARLRAEAGQIALLDTSPEAALARKLEAATHRTYFRALKELRAVERQVKAAEGEAIGEKLASILPGEMTNEEFDARYAEAFPANPPMPAARLEPIDFPTPGGRFDVPFTIGRRR